MADLREDFVVYVVKALVNNPDAVSLQRSQDEKGEFLELKVDPADMGKVIGKAGATAKSIRTLLRGVGAKDDMAPLPLKIVDPEDRQNVDTITSESSSKPVEVAPEAPVVEDDHDDLHARTKREMEELADLEL
jgi:predicted RNA-binding protein YlqC (UPF0109 family)